MYMSFDLIFNMYNYNNDLINFIGHAFTLIHELLHYPYQSILF